MKRARAVLWVTILVCVAAGIDAVKKAAEKRREVPTATTPAASPSTPKPRATAAPADWNHEGTAYAAAKRFVTDRLRYPKGKFPMVADSIQRLPNGGWEVKSWVDSTNVYGAPIRVAFSAQVRNTGGDTWVCEKLDLNEPTGSR